MQAISDETPRPVRVRPERHPGIGGLAALVLSLPVGLTCLMLALGLLLARFAGTRVSGWVNGPRTSIVPGFDVQYKVAGQLHSAWMANWNFESFEKYGRKTTAELYLSPLPGSSLVVAPDSDLALAWVLEIVMLGAVGGVLLTVPLPWVDRYRRQVALIRTGKVAQGVVIRHQPFDRRMGRMLPVWFEFKIEEADFPIEASMPIDRDLYRTIKNRDEITVVHDPANPYKALAYDFCDFEAVTVTFFEDEAKAPAIDDTLPEELDYKHGRGPKFLRNTRMVQTVLLILMLLTPLWGWAGYRLKPAPDLSMDVLGVLWLAPWLVLVFAALVGVYLVTLVTVWDFRKLFSPFSARREYTAEDLNVQEWDPEEIDDPIKTSLRKSGGR